ncbi:MAG: hypothetical protein DRP45_09830 [Candidatus Zixiibacteriota bacterium]|nr:MAG: hypothetical protein DRP45_09830 [candidate division Zixibacteria bacterium]
MDRIDCAYKWLTRTALAYLGTPYRWGGDDPSGFDCSGFVLECLKSVGFVDNQVDLTAEGLLAMFRESKITTPREGALLFQLNGQGTAIHVAICLDQWFQIAAAGGDRRTRQPNDAWRGNAFVRIRPIGRKSNQVICNPFGIQ